MTDRTDESRGGLDSAEAFSLLGNATRLEILNALHDGSTESPAQFSALYDCVEIADSAQFNYHLKQLVPHFVTKSDDGYELTAAGMRLARAVTAGTYTDVPRLDPFGIDGHCYTCGAVALQASYVDERFEVECRDCGERVLGVHVPPTVVRGREPDEVVAAFDRWSRVQVEQVRRGICPDCGGAVEPSVTETVDETIRFEAAAVFDCSVCKRRTVTSFGALASQQPAVQAFHRRRGKSIRDRPYWEIDQLIAGEHVAVVSRNPWLARVSFFAAGDACHVDVDDDLEIAGIEIVPGAGKTPISEDR